MKITGGLLAVLGVLILLAMMSDDAGHSDVQRAAVTLVGALFVIGGLVVVSLQQIREAVARTHQAAQRAAQDSSPS